MIKMLEGERLVEVSIKGTDVIGEAIQGAIAALPATPALGEEGEEVALAAMGVGVEVSEDVEVGVGVAVATGHVGAVIVSVVVETVPPNAKALPVQSMVEPIVMPEASMLVPANVELAPSVVAAVGVQKTSQAEAPERETTELATVVNAPFILKMYVPLPESVMPAVPIEAALEAAVQ